MRRRRGGENTGKQGEILRGKGEEGFLAAKSKNYSGVFVCVYVYVCVLMFVCVYIHVPLCHFNSTPFSNCFKKGGSGKKNEGKKGRVWGNSFTPPSLPPSPLLC